MTFNFGKRWDVFVKTGFFTGVIVAVFLFSGCSWFGTKEEKTAEQLARDGMAYFKSEDYNDAVKSFENLKDWYPFSKYAILAELKIADAYFQLGRYEDAIFEYENFENLHPRNEAVPYVVYQIGTCYFRQINTIDRDQTPAQKALDTFTRLQSLFPKNRYSRRAQKHIKKCLQNLAGHELYVGRFYFNTGHYRTALSRFESVIENFPDVGIHHEAIEYIARCKQQMKAENQDDE